MARLEHTFDAASKDQKIAITPSDFDLGHWLITCQNGTLDLKRCELRAFDTKD